MTSGEFKALFESLKIPDDIEISIGIDTDDPVNGVCVEKFKKSAFLGRQYPDIEEMNYEGVTRIHIF